MATRKRTSGARKTTARKPTARKRTTTAKKTGTKRAGSSRKKTSPARKKTAAKKRPVKKTTAKKTTARSTTKRKTTAARRAKGSTQRRKRVTAKYGHKYDPDTCSGGGYYLRTATNKRLKSKGGQSLRCRCGGSRGKCYAK